MQRKATFFSRRTSVAPVPPPLAQHPLVIARLKRLAHALDIVTITSLRVTDPHPLPELAPPVECDGAGQHRARRPHLPRRFEEVCHCFQSLGHRRPITAC